MLALDFLLYGIFLLGCLPSSEGGGPPSEDLEAILSSVEIDELGILFKRAGSEGML